MVGLASCAGCGLAVVFHPGEHGVRTIYVMLSRRWPVEETHPSLPSVRLVSGTPGPWEVFDSACMVDGPGAPSQEDADIWSNPEREVRWVEATEAVKLVNEELKL